MCGDGPVQDVTGGGVNARAGRLIELHATTDQGEAGCQHHLWLHDPKIDPTTVNQGREHYRAQQLLVLCIMKQRPMALQQIRGEHTVGHVSSQYQMKEDLLTLTYELAVLKLFLFCSTILGG
jgi:hypothetical protein